MSRIDELEARIVSLEKAVLGGVPPQYHAGRPPFNPNAVYDTLQGLHEGLGGVGVSIR